MDHPTLVNGPDEQVPPGDISEGHARRAHRMKWVINRCSSDLTGTSLRPGRGNSWIALTGKRWEACYKLGQSATGQSVMQEDGGPREVSTEAAETTIWAVVYLPLPSSSLWNTASSCLAASRN